MNKKKIEKFIPLLFFKMRKILHLFFDYHNIYLEYNHNKIIIVKNCSDYILSIFF